MIGPLRFGFLLGSLCVWTRSWANLRSSLLCMHFFWLLKAKLICIQPISPVDKLGPDDAITVHCTILQKRAPGCTRRFRSLCSMALGGPTEMGTIGPRIMQVVNEFLHPTSVFWGLSVLGCPKQSSFQVLALSLYRVYYAAHSAHLGLLADKQHCLKTREAGGHINQIMLLCADLLASKAGRKVNGRKEKQACTLRA